MAVKTLAQDYGEISGTVSYLYDSLNRRTRLQWPDGFYVNYSFDAVSELTSITDSDGASVATYAYDNLGNRTGITRGNGIGTSYTYDSFSNLTNLTHGSLQSYSLAYNAGGQIKSQTSSNDNFAYRASAMSRAYGINGLNQTTASGSLTVSYDGRGNVSSDGVNTYAYDVANRLTSMSSSATLSYDPLSRLSKTVGSATTQFLYDGTDLIAEFDGSGNLLRRYIHGPGSDEPVAWYEGSGTANRQWLLANAQGSVIAVTNASGGVTATNTYDEYGLPGSGNTGRFQYTGQKWIPEIGMYDYKARIYSPGFGRFLQTDPIGYGDGPNWYAYVHGDPVNGIDPAGTEGDDGGYSIPTDDPSLSIFAPDDIIVRAKRLSGQASLDDEFTLFEAVADPTCYLCHWHGAPPVPRGAPPVSHWPYPPPRYPENIVAKTRQPPKDAHDPNGAKAPGKPGAAEGFEDPKSGEAWGQAPNGQWGWVDDKGNIWVPTGQGGAAHGAGGGLAGAHWDVQLGGGGYVNVYPGGNTR